MFWQNEELGKGRGQDIYMDGVICVIDGLLARKQLEERRTEIAETAQRQIACADVILLNKADLVKDEEELKSLEKVVRGINPAAPIHRTSHGRIDVGDILSINAYGARGLEEVVSSDEHTAHELGGIGSVVIPLPTMDEGMMARFEEWLQSVLWEDVLPGGERVEVLRCKGVIIGKEDEEYVVQGVGRMYEIEKSGRCKCIKEGKLVLIGFGLENVGSVLRSVESRILPT